jgi:hypothetical protein
MLREVGMDPGSLEREARDATRIGREEIAEVGVANGAVVTPERLPGGAVAERVGHGRRAAGS